MDRRALCWTCAGHKIVSIFSIVSSMHSQPHENLTFHIGGFVHTSTMQVLHRKVKKFLEYL